MDEDWKWSDENFEDTPLFPIDSTSENVLGDGDKPFFEIDYTSENVPGQDPFFKIGCSSRNPFSIDTSFIPEEGFYQPSTEDTREAYQALLSIIEYNSISIPSYTVLCVVAEEILSIMKERIDNPIYKRSQIEKLLMPISNSTFNQLVLVARIITDHPQVASKGLYYQPTSEKMWECYQGILNVVKSYNTNALPLLNQCMVANDILSILKDGSLTTYDKEMNIQKHLGYIPRYEFDRLVYLAELISDFGDYKGDPLDAGDPLMDESPNGDYSDEETDDADGLGVCLGDGDGEGEGDDRIDTLDLHDTMVKEDECDELQHGICDGDGDRDGDDKVDTLDLHDVMVKEEKYDEVQQKDDEDKDWCDEVQQKEDEDKDWCDEVHKDWCDEVQEKDDEDKDWLLVDYPDSD